ncbi:hypothetical protein [Nocardia crassostreae]|uniref:hypothetical protein n=1 Tax=Nocardia crassostreae TaxID=53428 RepID=UPI00082C222C|nr:hypothetical protein [Nocardia crassostreae]
MYPADSARELEIRVLADVIAAAEYLLQGAEAAGSTVAVPLAEVYAIIIRAVMASARAGGHYGPGSLAYAPLLDAILAGVDATPWDAAVFAVLVDGVVVD